MDVFTLDQFAVFVTVVEEGSFAAAARRLGRAQSAITYAIHNLEEQSRLTLFDRSAYRPVLTEAGKTLLPRAKRIMDDVADYRLQANGIAKGLEAELTLVVDAYTPADLLSRTLKAFSAAFPIVSLRISVESFEAAAGALKEGRADIGLLMETVCFTEEFERDRCAQVDLVAVAAPDHPLAGLEPPFDAKHLRDHTQLVLNARLQIKNSRDYGVHAANRWSVTDLDTKHLLLLAGVGWGSMPRPRVAADLAAGRLVVLQPERWGGADRMPEFPLAVCIRKGRPLGPAGRWLAQQFIAEAALSRR